MVGQQPLGRVVSLSMTNVERVHLTEAKLERGRERQTIDLVLAEVQDIGAERQHAELRQFLGRLISGLAEGDSIESLVGIQLGDSGSLEWRLRLRTSGGGLADKPRRDFQALSRAVGLEFVPAPPLPAGLLPWRARYSPTPMLLSCQSRPAAGFRSAHGAKRNTIALAHPWPSSASIDAFLPVMVQSRQRLAVRVLLTRMRLSPEREALVTAVHEWMTRSGVPREWCSAADPDGEIVLSGLSQWTRVPYGVHIAVELCADAPVSPGVVEAFSQSMRPDVPTAGSREVSSCDGLLVDLSRLVNVRDVLPLLVPTHRALLSVGTRRRIPWTAAPPQVRGVCFGHSVATASPLHITTDDRMRHVYICGATGTGKSTLLLDLIRQDLADGQGLCVVDPHGDLFWQVLDQVPKRRVDDVIVLDPADEEAVVGLNLLDCGGPLHRVQVNFVVNEMIRIFDRLYNLAVTGGPMFEQYMRNGLLLLLENDIRPQTLLHLPALFEDGKYRSALVKRCRNAAVANFWRYQAERATGEAALNNMAPYITSKLNQFTTNHVMRSIVGQARPRFSVGDAMDHGDRKSTRLNSSHSAKSRMPSSA